jgi:hypothetical protein
MSEITRLSGTPMTYNAAGTAVVDFAALDTSTIRTLTTAEIAALTTADISLISADAIPGMTTQQISALSTGSITSLSADQLAAMTSICSRSVVSVPLKSRVLAQIKFQR